MRRLVWISALAFALAAPAVGFALSGDDDGTLSVKAGVGRVSLNFNGSAVGRLQRGSIQVTDPVAGDGVGFEFTNCDLERDKSDTTTNRNDTIRVGTGLATLNGAGDDPSVDSDGAYSLNDKPYRSLPDFLTTLILAAPSGG